MEQLNLVTVTEDFENRIAEATKALSDLEEDSEKAVALCGNVCQQIDAITRCRYIENGEPTDLLEIIRRPGWMELLKKRQQERRLRAMKEGRKRTRLESMMLKNDMTSFKRFFYQEEQVMDKILAACISDDAMNVVREYSERTGDRRPFLKNKLLQIQIVSFLYREAEKGSLRAPFEYVVRGILSFISARIIPEEELALCAEAGSALRLYDEDRNLIRYLMRETGYYQSCLMPEEELERTVEIESKELLEKMDHFLDDSLEDIIDCYMKANIFQKPRQAYLAVYPRIRNIREKSPRPVWFSTINDLADTIKARNDLTDIETGGRATFKIFVDSMKEKWKAEQRLEALIRSGLHEQAPL